MAFEVPSLGDQRLEELVDLYRAAGIDLSDGFDDMIEEDDSGNRFSKYSALLLLLLLLFNRSKKWAEENLTVIIRGADAVAVRKVLTIRPGAVLSPGLDPSVQQTILANTIGFFFKARSLLEQQLGRIFRTLGLEQEFADIAAAIRTGDPTISPEDLDRKIRRALVKEFRTTPVAVIGKGGRTFKFPLDYYAAMVAHNAKFQAQSMTEVARALEAGLDLVQISSNPSLHGDWCDAYRGRVFSITGRTPGFPRLDQIPNNGAPFHPWCRHTMSIFDPTGYSPEQLRVLGGVDARFLLSQSNDFNAMVRAWWRSR